MGRNTLGHGMGRPSDHTKILQGRCGSGEGAEHPRAQSEEGIPQQQKHAAKVWLRTAAEHPGENMNKFGLAENSTLMNLRSKEEAE